jgi:hypothetical protein
MKKAINLPRVVRGKRPAFFETPGVDDVLSMVVVLAQEMTVLRERLDSAEIVCAKHGIALTQEIEALPMTEALLAEREAWRQRFYERLFYLAQQRRSELEEKHTAESYQRILDDIARRE